MSNISRRAMLGATGGLIAGGLLKTQANALTVAARLENPTKVLGAATSVLGQRAPEEQPRRGMGRPATTTSSRTPIEQLQGITTRWRSRASASYRIRSCRVTDTRRRLISRRA
jgi:hypothetical protein